MNSATNTTTTPNRTPASARKAAKRDRILHAATRIFARNGFYNATVAEIAREAGVADGTIYLYFKSKDDILISIFEETVGSIIPGLRHDLELLPEPADRLRRFIRHHLHLVHDRPDLAAVLHLELRQSNKFLKEYKGSSLSDYLNLISEIIEDGQLRNVFASRIRPGIARRMVFGALDEMSTLWVLQQDRKFDVDDSAEQIADIFLDGMRVDGRR